MSGKPNFKKPTSKKGIKGSAVCKVGEKTFTFIYRDGEHEGERFTFKVSELPDDFPETVSLENGKKYFVALNPDGDELVSIRPVVGLLPVKTVDFARTNDEDFVIISAKNKYEATTVSVIAEVEVQSGDWKGVRVPIYLRISTGDSIYLQEDSDGNIMLVGNLEKSPPFQNLYEFWEYAIGDKPTKYDDDTQQLISNILKTILKEKNEFNIILDGGYVSKCAASDEIEDFSDEEQEDAADEDEVEEKEVPAKKSSKKEEVDDEDEDIR